MTTRLPKKISPCPINEAILEIRFQTRSDFVGDAVFGLVYNAFKDTYTDVRKQPVLQIPEQMRINDPALMYLPEYHVASGKFKILIGQRVFSVVVIGDYCGWTEFSSRVDDALGRIQDLAFIDRITRMGLRYINVFDFNIFDQSTLSLNHGDKPLVTKSSRIVSQIEAGKFEHTLTMLHGLTVRDGSNVIGDSVIDIDTALSSELSDFFVNRKDLIDEAHTREKQLFFSLLSNQYLESLHPEYE